MTRTIIATATGALLLAASACTPPNTPEEAVKQFCKLHTQREFEKAHAYFAAADRGGETPSRYAAFAWDQESFDVRIIGANDVCGAKAITKQENEALVELQLSNVHGRSFGCALPLIKEGEAWRVRRSYAPAATYAAARAEAQKNLAAAMTQAVPLEDEPYLAAAQTAFASFWQAIERAKKAFAESAGGAVPSLCQRELNPDGGADLIYDYLAFSTRNPDEDKPKMRSQDATHQALLELVSKEYRPLATVKSETARTDLIASGLTDDARAPLVHNVFAIWGDARRRFTWRVDVWSKGKQTNTGHGDPPEVVDDLSAVVPDAPPVKIVLVDFPRMPPETDRLDVNLFDVETLKEFLVGIPVKPEFVAAADWDRQAK